MTRTEKIELLKKMSSGNIQIGELIRDWIWTREENSFKCQTLNKLSVAESEFQQFVDRTGGRHFVFEPGIRVEIPSLPSWFDSACQIYVPNSPSWLDRDPHPELMEIQRFYPEETRAQVKATEVIEPAPEEPKIEAVQEIEIEPVEPSEFLKGFTFNLNHYSRNYFNQRF
jgi:hypothetical protein